jgi:predicted nucleotidyltransferase
MKNIYVFGSVVRGEIDEYSDVDLLLITDEIIKNIDSNKYSIYTPYRIKEMYDEGNPFAWHLFTESKIIHTNDINYLESLGKPNDYKNCYNDLIKFKNLFHESFKSLSEDNLSLIFDLAMIFLSIRNFATCYSLSQYEKPIFSRNSFEKLHDYPLILDKKVKELLMMSRISSTRGINYHIDKNELNIFINESKKIEIWFNKIIKNYENRVQ